ncbi:hypothetical protein [Rufibacter immobilis]|uniref:hypothetical protein n=1 Tax=Rufibacter immobilis TaxID=1348778 RepID=UPI0035E885A7
MSRFNGPSFKASFAVAALLYLFACFFSATPVHKVHYSPKAEKVVLTAGTDQTPAAPYVWKASEPLDPSGILHEAELSLLPLLFAFVALLFFPILQNTRVTYSSSTYKIFDFFRILPNAP